jgi:hypothetical protein
MIQSKNESCLAYCSLDRWTPRILDRNGAATDVRIATFYYPHWHVTANGKEMLTRTAADGALLIPIPAERASLSTWNFASHRAQRVFYRKQY